MRLPGCVIYDNGGRSADRYTIVDLTPYFDGGIEWHNHGYASADPYWPQGVGIADGRPRVDKPTSQHLGRKVKDHSVLPDAVRRFACYVCDTAEQLELF
jgi:hypothetical protein